MSYMSGVLFDMNCYYYYILVDVLPVFCIAAAILLQLRSAVYMDS